MDVKHEEIPLLQRNVANVRKATKCCSLSSMFVLCRSDRSAKNELRKMTAKCD